MWALTRQYVQKKHHKASSLKEEVPPPPSPQVKKGTKAEPRALKAALEALETEIDAALEEDRLH